MKERIMHVDKDGNVINDTIRDCDKCIHHVTKGGQTGCESLECEYERRADDE